MDRLVAYIVALIYALIGATALADDLRPDAKDRLISVIASEHNDERAKLYQCFVSEDSLRAKIAELEKKLEEAKPK